MGIQRDKFGLLPRHRAFCNHYLADPERIASRAYKKAYPNAKKSTANTHGYRLLSRPEVAEYIKKAGERGAKKANVDADRVILEMARVGLSDVRKLVGPDGNLKPIGELDDDTAAAVQSVDVCQPPNKQEVVTKIKFWPKGQALEQLGKVHALFTEKMELSEKGGLAEMMERHRKRKKS
ncbi:MAG: terminase small subunit [Magnetococcales bacterium]|nr:terminase small subunit [Magnetococcales bacterium]